MSEQGYFFICVNGDTAHNNPAETDCYVRNEPPQWPETFFNYADLCLSRGFIRIGWPGTGDLRQFEQIPLRTRCYGSFKPRVRRYLDEFRRIPQRSIVLMPDKERPGVIYIGETTSAYAHSPELPIECAHRIRVKWDRRNGCFATYSATGLQISIQHGFWKYAFQNLSRCKDRGLTRRIDAARRHRE